MPDSKSQDNKFHDRYAQFYALSLIRIVDLCRSLGNTAALEPMERAAACKAALARIAFIAEATPTTADLLLGLPDP